MKNETHNLENLTTNEIIEILKSLRLGCYHSFTKKHVENNGCYFIRTYVGRLASYSSVSGKEETEIKPTNGQITIIPNVLYYNENTQNYLLSIKTTKKLNHHSKTHYYNANGVEITKEEYEMVNPPKKSYGKPSTMFKLVLSELIAVK